MYFWKHIRLELVLRFREVRVSASQNDGKKQMALKCTEMSFFSCFIIQIGSSTSIFFFPGVDLIAKPKFGDQNCHL